MRVLHYIPRSLNVGSTAQYLSALIQTMQPLAEVSVADTLSDYRASLDRNSPDIVHLHGCWTRRVVQAQRMAEHQGYPVVRTLHGALLPWNTPTFLQAVEKSHYHLYVEKSIRQADAVHTLSPIEQSRLEQLAWNQRTACIPNCIITHQIDAATMGARMLVFYQKVIDSNTFRLMTNEEIRAESLLLVAGIHASHATAHTDNMRNLFFSHHNHLLNNLTEDSWRKILIHANDEHILDDVKKGAKYLLSANHTAPSPYSEIDLDDININSVDRFPQKLQKTDGLLSTSRVDPQAMTHSIATRLSHVRQDEKPTEEEMALCILLLNTRHHLRSNSLSRQHLAQLYTVLRFTDYDEDRVARSLKLLHLSSFTQRLCQILQDSLMLPEGYMPVEPRKDQATTQIMKKLKILHIQ